MSSAWAEFNSRSAEIAKSGDSERLSMIRRFQEAWQYRETNPELRLDLITRCRDDAKHWNDWWWEIFFEHWRLGTMTSDLHDFSRALPLAIELMVRLNTADGRLHSEYAGILIEVLYTYFEIDPFGYQEEIEQGFAYLLERTRNDNVDERFVLNYRRTHYLLTTERFNDAFELANQQLAIANETDNMWFSAWYLFLLCRICHKLDLIDELEVNATLMIDQSAGKGSFRRTRADGQLWLAVALQSRGDERAAVESFHKGMRHLQNLDRKDDMFADAIATYYELREDFRAAAGVREREIADREKCGSLHTVCVATIERCRLLAKAGELNEIDVSRANEAVGKMKRPDWYCDRLYRIEK
jgi:hypothetical protein